MSEIQKNIAATLKAYMHEKGLTQEEYALELGIARSSLQEYLKEDSNPRADTIELLAKRLGIPPSALVSDNTEKVQRLLQNPEAQALHPLFEPVVERCMDLVAELYRLSDILRENGIT